MLEVLESSDSIIAWALEVAFPASTQQQREAIVHGMTAATRGSILEIVTANSTSGTDVNTLPTEVRAMVMRLVLGSAV